MPQEETTIEKKSANKFVLHRRNILIIFILTMVLTSCDVGSSDGTVENWFVLILLMLCWLKGVLF